MADLIDKQALIEQINIERKMSRTSYPKRPFTVGDTLQCIYDAPTIDPESLRPQGEWVDLYGGKYANPRYACSNCGEKALYKFEKDDLDRTIAVQALSDSCPNCGAKMKGETK